MGFFEKLKQGLAKTRSGFSEKISGVLSAFTRVDEDLLEELEEALILCGFDNQAVNLLLSSIRRGRLKNVPLKAMLTPNNISWTIETILQELSKEHEYFHKKR